MKLQIVWTTSELDDCIAHIVKEHGLDKSKWPQTFYTLLNKAQKVVLEKHRWRLINGPMSIGKRVSMRFEQWERAEGRPPVDWMPAPPHPKLVVDRQNPEEPETKAQSPSVAPPPAPSVAPLNPALPEGKWRPQLGTVVAPPPAPRPTPATPPTQALAPVAPAPRPTPAPVRPTPLAAPAFTASQVSDMLSTFIAGVVLETVKKVMASPDLQNVLQGFTLGQWSAAVPSLPPPVEPPAPHAPAPQVLAFGKPVAKHNPEPHSAPRAAKTVVLMCGIRADQQAQFLTAFPNLHLKFWHEEKPNRGLETLKAKAANADVVLFKLEQTSHSAVAVVDTLKKPVRRVQGSMSAMHDMLATIK